MDADGRLKAEFRVWYGEVGRAVIEGVPPSPPPPHLAPHVARFLEVDRLAVHARLAVEPANSLSGALGGTARLPPHPR